MTGGGAVPLVYDQVGPTGGPVVVLLGSLGSRRSMWRPQTDPTTALAGQFRLIAVDLRGHGDSPAPVGPYTVADLAGDVLALLDRLEVGAVHIVGISLGGAVAQWLAAHHPQRVRTLAAISTTDRFATPDFWRDRATLVAAEGTAGIATAVVDRWFTPEFALENPGIVQEFQNQVAGASPTGYAACCHALAGFDASDFLAQVQAPTLVIAGATDPSTPLETVARVHTAIAGSRMVTIDPGAHLVTIEQKELVSAVLGAFWSENPDTP